MGQTLEQVHVPEEELVKLSLSLSQSEKILASFLFYIFHIHRFFMNQIILRLVLINRVW